MRREVRRWLGALAVVGVLLGGCGGTTRGALQPLERLDEGTLEVKLADEATWLAVAVHSGSVFVLGQTAESEQVYDSRERYLVSHDPATGEERWRADFEMPEDAVPSYFSDLVTTRSVLVMAADHVFMGLSPKDGRLLWTINNQGVKLDLVGVDGDRLYATSRPNLLYAFNARDGSQIARWEMDAHTNPTAAWLTPNGDHLVAIADVASEPSKKAVIRLDTRATASADVTELYRFEPKLYDDGGVRHELPSRYGLNSPRLPVRTDHIIGLTLEESTTPGEGPTLKVKCWSATRGELAWEEAVELREGERPGDANRLPALLVGGDRALRQQRREDGVLLGSALALDAMTLSDFDHNWSTRLPTRDHVTHMSDAGGGTLLLQTQPSTGATSDRWLLVDARSGRLLWRPTLKRIQGQTRSIVVGDDMIVRLRTTNWINGRLYIDRIDLPER